jgi:hypothetical protein
MVKKKLLTAGLITLVVFVLNFQLGLAHETVTVDEYEIEYGWLNEPVIANQQNAIVVNVSDTSSGAAQPVEDVSALTVTVSYGGQSKTLTLQPLGEDTPGQFVAPILPTIPGQYTLTFGGKLGDTVVNNVAVEPEEVETADALQFPSVSSTEPNTNTSIMNWLVYLSLLIGLIALVLGVMGLRKSH